jgi:transposase
MAFMEKRRKFSAQFKAEAVQMVIQTGHPVSQVARELQINSGTLGNWVNMWKRENPEPEADLTPMDRARMTEMQKEIRELRMENDFLKKAAGFFARNQ